jgi:hypothetical protein
MEWQVLNLVEIRKSNLLVSDVDYENTIQKP